MDHNYYFQTNRHFLPQKPGLYILVLFLEEERTIHIGSLGPVAFHAGFYAYLGSAMGGLKKRLQRYYSARPNKRWHIDYLVEEAFLSETFVLLTSDKIECEISAYLSRHLEMPVRGFGASDCTCFSHLYYSHSAETLNEVIETYCSEA